MPKKWRDEYGQPREEIDGFVYAGSALPKDIVFIDAPEKATEIRGFMKINASAVFGVSHLSPKPARQFTRGQDFIEQIWIVRQFVWHPDLTVGIVAGASAGVAGGGRSRGVKLMIPDADSRCRCGVVFRQRKGDAEYLDRVLMFVLQLVASDGGWVCSCGCA